MATQDLWKFDNVVIPNPVVEDVIFTSRATVTETLNNQTILTEEVNPDLRRRTPNIEYLLSWVDVEFYGWTLQELLHFLMTLYNRGKEFFVEAELFKAERKEEMIPTYTSGSTAYTQYETNFPWIAPDSFTFYKNGTLFTLGTSGSSFNSGTGVLTIDQQQATDKFEITYTRKPKVQIIELQPRPVMGVYPVRYVPFARLREVTPT